MHGHLNIKCIVRNTFQTWIICVKCSPDDYAAIWIETGTLFVVYVTDEVSVFGFEMWNFLYIMW